MNNRTDNYALSTAQSGRMLLRGALAVAPETRRLELIAQVGKGLLGSLDRPLKHVSLAEIEHTKGILSWLRDQYREEQKSEECQAVIASAIARGRTA